MITKSDIRLCRSLADRRARTETGLFLAEGAKLVGELRASALRVRRIFAAEGLFEGPEVTPVSAAELERLSLLKTPSNAVALVEIPRRTLRPERLRDRLVLALDDIRDPGNLGTILRIADWFGIGEVVCSATSADCFNPKAVQATMGAILRVAVHYTDLPRFLDEAVRLQMPVCGTFLDGEGLYEAPLPRAALLVVGNEGHGIGAACASRVTRRLYIPPYPADRHGSESLNAAMATAIVCAEFRRRCAAGTAK